MAWTDEKRAEAIKMYLAAEPTPETSVSIVKEIADELGETANGVRMILSKAEVYVKAESAGKPTAAKAKGEAKEGGTRVNKEAAHKALLDAISAHGLSPDEEIVSKLTGKAAVYFAEIISSLATE